MKELPELSTILEKMLKRLLRDPTTVPSLKAAEVALFFANAAWNESVGVDFGRESYRYIWETLEAKKPDLWNELKSNDINAMIDELVEYKKAQYPNDARRILICGIPEGKVYAEWLQPARQGADIKWEMRLFGLVRRGENKQAIQFLQESRDILHDAAKKIVAEIWDGLDHSHLSRFVKPE